MAISLSLEIYRILETKLNKEDAEKIAKAIEVSLDSIEQKTIDLSLQKKLELKDELSKELASKADLALIENRLKNEIALVENSLKNEIALSKAKLDNKLNFLIVLMIIALTLMNPVVADIIKSWLN